MKLVKTYKNVPPRKQTVAAEKKRVNLLKIMNNKTVIDEKKNYNLQMIGEHQKGKEKYMYYLRHIRFCRSVVLSASF